MKGGKKLTKTIKILIIILIGIVVCYFGTKGFFLYSYNKTKISNDNFIWQVKDAFDNKGNLTITKKTADKYFTFNDLKITNVFTKTETENLYSLNNSDIKVKFSKENKDALVKTAEEESKNIGFKYDLTNEFAQNNIDNDYKLYEYLLENLNQKLNIFSSINNLKKAQSINLLSEIMSSNYQKITILDGDLDGFIFETKNTINVYIIHQNDCYKMEIFNNNKELTNFTDIISTISFD